jgi:hypothetical protein
MVVYQISVGNRAKDWLTHLVDGAKCIRDYSVHGITRLFGQSLETSPRLFASTNSRISSAIDLQSSLPPILRTSCLPVSHAANPNTASVGFNSLAIIFSLAYWITAHVFLSPWFLLILPTCHLPQNEHLYGARGLPACLGVRLQANSAVSLSLCATLPPHCLRRILRLLAIRTSFHACMDESGYNSAWLQLLLQGSNYAPAHNP